MKKFFYNGSLPVTHPLISANCSSFTTSVKNRNTYSPPLKQTKHTQAVTPALQTTHNKIYKRNIASLLSLFWLWLLARFYITEKSRRIPGWQLEVLALLKSTKDNARRLWNNRCPDRKIIRLEDCKQNN